MLGYAWRMACSECQVVATIITVMIKPMIGSASPSATPTPARMPVEANRFLAFPLFLLLRRLATVETIER